MDRIASLVSGIVFGLGLKISEMINPAKVLGFLDLFGNWDPSLMFVMIFAGLLVGVGTRISGGCTSGHGNSGIGRFSLRSIIATVSFMTVGIITVLINNFI